MIKGIPASSGIAMGKAFVLPTWDWDVQEEEVDAIDLAKEFERLYEVVNTSKNEIQSMRAEVSNSIGVQESLIFDAHLAILDDPAFMEEVHGIIQRQYKAAEFAVKEAIEKFSDMFEILDDEYMRERAVDIRDVGNRLIKHLLGTPEIRLPENNEPFILVAKEIAPSQITHLNPSHVQGILTWAGAHTSHSAIIARALGIPMIVGLESELPESIRTGDELVMDGDSGTVVLNPDQETMKRYQMKQEQRAQDQQRLQEIAAIQTKTEDGVPFNLEVNLNALKELDPALEKGANGVGLFRTEFMFMDRKTFPSEEEQYQIYLAAIEMLDGKPLTIRILETGGDKKLEFYEYPEEMNPFLGYRAIRISLDRIDDLKTQLRALLRVSVHGPVRVVYPMVSSLKEIRQVNRVLEECKEECRQSGTPYADMQIGVMIELPAAVLIADLIAEEVDFFSIGTNDLVQYVLAVDRSNEHVAHLYDPYHPAVLRMLKMTAEVARDKGIDLTICGEMAGDPRSLPIWMGLGISNLSMSVTAILKVKDRILQSNFAEGKKLFEEIMNCATSEEIHQLLEQFYS